MDIGFLSNNTFMEDTFNITVNGTSGMLVSGNIFGKNNSLLTFNYFGFNNNETTNNFSNKTFELEFDYVKILISDDTIKTYNTAPYSKVIVDMTDGTDLWYKTIDILGTITTNKLI